MQNIFIELLPPWIETGLQPAFYDKESGTVLQQVSRMWAKMIELGQGFNTFAGNTTTTVNSYITKFNELYTYVHDYFDNLDVQEEVNNKLDTMVEDGTLNTIIGSYVDTYVADTNERLNTVEGTVSDLSNDVENVQEAINGQKRGIVGISRVGLTEPMKHAIVYSDDGKHFYKVADLEGRFSDASALTEINGKFYLFGSNIYWLSDDLVNWSEGHTVKSDYTYSRIWATYPYYDNVNETLYLYSAYQYAPSEDTITNIYGTEVYRFKISYQTATINADGTLNINSTIHDILYDADNTYIDPAVTYDKARGLLMAYKDEVNGKVHFRIMNSPTSLSSNDYTCPVYGIEACQLLSNDSGTMCYVDCYGLTNNQVTGGLNISGGRTAYIEIPTSGSIQAKNLGLISVLRPFHLRHPGLMYASEKAYNIVLQLGIKPSTLCYADNVNSLENGTYFVSTGSATNPVLINLPDVVYTVSSNKTVKALPFFRDTPLKLYNRKNRAITWTSDSWANSDTVNHTFTPNSDGFMYIPANSNDCLTGMWLPIDRT